MSELLVGGCPNLSTMDDIFYVRISSSRDIRWFNSRIGGPTRKLLERGERPARSKNDSKQKKLPSESGAFFFSATSLRQRAKL